MKTTRRPRSHMTVEPCMLIVWRREITTLHCTEKYVISYYYSSVRWMSVEHLKQNLRKYSDISGSNCTVAQ